MQHCDIHYLRGSGTEYGQTKAVIRMTHMTSMWADYAQDSSKEASLLDEMDVESETLHHATQNHP